jgi:hypothetical protein
MNIYEHNTHPYITNNVRNKEADTKVLFAMRAQSNSSINLTPLINITRSDISVLTMKTHKPMQFGTAEDVLRRSTFRYTLQTKYFIVFDD